MLRIRPTGPPKSTGLMYGMTLTVGPDTPAPPSSRSRSSPRKRLCARRPLIASDTVSTTRAKLSPGRTASRSGSRLETMPGVIRAFAP